MPTSDHLYVGYLSHEDSVTRMPESIRRAIEAEMEADDDDVGLASTVLVLAPSQVEAERRVREHYGIETPMTLAPSGFVTLLGEREAAVAVGVRGDIDPKELDKCPSCHSNHVRHDASAGETDCVDCGWGMSWTGAE